MSVFVPFQLPFALIVVVFEIIFEPAVPSDVCFCSVPVAVCLTVPVPDEGGLDLCIWWVRSIAHSWIGSDQTVIRVPHRRLVVQERKEDGEAHDEEAGKTGVVDYVEHRDLQPTHASATHHLSSLLVPEEGEEAFETRLLVRALRKLVLSRRSARFLLIVDLLALLHQLALLGSSRLLVPSHPEKSSRPLTWPQKLTNCRLPTTWKTALRKFESLADGLPQLIYWWRLLSPHGSPSAGSGCGVCCAVGLSSNSLLLSSPSAGPGCGVCCAVGLSSNSPLL